MARFNEVGLPGVLDERLHATQGLRKEEEVGPSANVECLLFRVDLERHHPPVETLTGRVHLAGGHLVPVVRQQAGVVDASDVRMGQQPLGNLGRNTMRNRPDFNWDFSAMKDFAFTERLRRQFRFEAFHASNPRASDSRGRASARLPSGQSQALIRLEISSSA